jgi:hypothetical protein
MNRFIKEVKRVDHFLNVPWFYRITDTKTGNTVFGTEISEEAAWGQIQRCETEALSKSEGEV